MSGHYRIVVANCQVGGLSRHFELSRTSLNQYHHFPSIHFLANLDGTLHLFKVVKSFLNRKSVSTVAVVVFTVVSLKQTKSYQNLHEVWRSDLR